MLGRSVLRAACRTAVRTHRPICQGIYRSTPVISSISPRAVAVPSIRFYSAPAGLSKEEIEGRIVDLLKNFDKVTDNSKVNGNTTFNGDLGLDSLDIVEVVMAIEEEFSIEIPDKEADVISSVKQAVDYIASCPDAN